MHSQQRKVLRTICPDQKGLIARITNICYKHELNIVQNNEFVCLLYTSPSPRDTR